MNTKYFLKVGLTVLLCGNIAAALTSCSGDDDVDTGISVITDKQTPENDLDRWLMKNYVEPYNIEMRYRWEDNEMQMDYILVPAKYENAIRMAKILKYICFDAFDEVTGSKQFIRAYFPKIIQLVGNPGWSPSADGSYILGQAEGGYKISLYYVNHLGDTYYDASWQSHDVITSREQLNTNYFHTIIHEFAHVFHQKVPYSNAFTQITGTDYVGGMYSSVFSSNNDPRAYLMGFVTASAACNADEDFAEVFSTYICSTPEEFELILATAGDSGRQLLERKVSMVRNYFKANWGLDLDRVRDAVQTREANLEGQDFDDISL